jgi:small subunit ribosomal protein S5
MTEEITKKENELKDLSAEASAKVEENKTQEAPKADAKAPTSSGAPKAGGFVKREFTKNIRPKNKRSSKRPEKPRSEYDNKIISIRRVVRVVKGGRRFSFSVAIISGNKKGSVGVGVGKASDTALAIEKATRSAKKAMIKVKLDKNMRIAHDVSAKYTASVVAIRPSPEKGMVAGSSLRNVLELAGVKDVSAKVMSRSKNKLNNARAAIKALEQLN